MRLHLVILAVLAVVLAAVALRAVKLVLIPVLVALLLTAAIRPLVHFLEHRNIAKAAATFVSLLTCLGVLLGIGAAVAYSISAQWEELVSSSDVGLARLDQTIVRSPLPFSEQEVRQARENAFRSLTGDLSVGDAFAALNTIGTFLTGLLMMIVVLFFFLKDGQTIWLFLTRRLKGDRLARTMRAGNNAVEVLGSYVRGVMVVASIDAAGIGLAMLVLGVPLALPLTAIVFLGGFIPVAGATITGIFVVLFASVTNGPGAALALAAAVIAVQQLEGNLLQPAIMGMAVKLHPLVILIALAIGAILAGIIGAVLAVPIAAVLWSAIKGWNDTPEEQKNHEYKGQGKTS